MTHTRRTAITAAVAIATSFATMAFAQTPAVPSAGGTTSGSTGASSMTGTSRGNAALTPPPSGSMPAQSRATDPLTAPSGRGGDSGASRTSPSAATTPRGDALGAGTVTGGVPALGGVTPNRAELPASAFGKLDASSRGYITLDDVRQLGGFEPAFRQADHNGDGRLNMSEFNTAWGIYTANVR